jgi:hypothetical protein
MDYLTKFKKYVRIPPPQRHNMSLMDFMVSPPGCGWSVTDVCWDAHEAQLRCPNEVDGDTVEAVYIITDNVINQLSLSKSVVPNTLFKIN